MATRVTRSEGIGEIVTAALFKEAIQRSTDEICGMMKEAKVDSISVDGLVRIVIAAYGAAGGMPGQAPFMSEDMREELFSTLVRELQPMAKQPQFSIGDVRLFWPKLVAKMRAKGMPLPDFGDPRIQGIVKEVVQTLHGAFGQGAGKHVSPIDQQANDWMGRMNAPAPEPMPGPVAR
jgi:hypothetical protein